MAVNKTDVSFLEKVIYEDNFEPKDLVGNAGLFADIPHKTDFSSAVGIKFSVATGGSGGASAVHAKAVANASAAKGYQFTVPQTEYSTFCSVEHQVYANATNGTAETHVYDQIKAQADMAVINMRNELGRQAFGRRTGARGRCSATVAPSGTTITLDHPSMAINFFEDMWLNFANTEGTILTDGATGVGRTKVIAVDPEAGTLTVNGTVTSQVSGITTGTYIYREGDAYDGSNFYVGSGLSDWCPATVTSTPFNGVDRTKNKVKLAGVRVDASNDAVDVAFIKAMAMAQSQTGGFFQKGTIYLHPQNLAALEASKEGGKWITTDGPYGIGIEKFSIGGFTFAPDHFAEINTAYMVSEGAFVRASCGDGPNWVKVHGDEFVYDPDTNTWRATYYWLGNFVALRPGQIMRIKLPAAISV